MLAVSGPAYAAPDATPPASPVRLIFIHHSTGENWLADENGGLGIALRDNNYFVSDTNYGWGLGGIGDSTDFGHWWLWFRGPDSPAYLNDLFQESNQHASYSRITSVPAGNNEIVLFKSCFPNSALLGNPADAIPAIDSNPLRGEGSGSEHHTVANAKGIYLDLLEYFRARQDKLFVAITAPPQQDASYSDNARHFNNWLINDWLKNYPYNNVGVFDFFNVLTTNGGNPLQNDLGWTAGNHHRWLNGAVQHRTDGDDDISPNVLEYPSDDDHPNQAGNLKATGEFVPLLNYFYNRWKATASSTVTVYEFYHPGLDHYFRTADPGEANAIDNGSAGPGWQRTGDNFPAYSATGAPAGTAQVCRFYGSVSPGPNSHFYTADSQECQGLIALQAATPATEKRWNYEGIAYAISLPVSSACPSGLQPVYRLYNNGFSRGVDSNHRYTIQQSEYQRLIGSGWIGEGIVMCAAR